MPKKKSGLGRGLGALIPQGGAATATVEPKKPAKKSASVASQDEPVVTMGGISEIDLEKIVANPNQPRVTFGHQELEELTDSVRRHGILQPLALADLGDGTYEVIAGERRLRAAQMAGLKSVPALIREANNSERFILALIENIQREDLNPLEEALAYERLSKEYGLRTADIAQQVGKAASTISNMTRLLTLSDDMKEAVKNGRLSVGNAKALLSIIDPAARNKLFRKLMAGEKLTVRDIEAKAQKKSTRTHKDPQVMAMEEELRGHYSTKVSVSNRAGRGRIIMEFFSDEEYEALVQKLLK
jgi:ParB family chromosome partitioning protein